MGSAEHVDVLIVGAGISGIAAAYYLQTRCPKKTYTILEGRNVIGGTWDLFRYPGVRSDSDMHTLGYSFRPWREEKAIAGGPSILKYIRETAAAYGIDQKIRFGHQVRCATWSSADATWTVEAETGPDGEIACFTCNFLYMCSGYYDYAHGYTPDWPGIERFAGRIVHPQQWPDDLDYDGKRVVVIGSGATAVTLVPALAERAAHVTMLQRSPTYIVARPSEDAIANWLRQHLPASVAPGAARWKSVLFGMYFYNLARRKPAETKQAILKMTREQLGPDYDIEKHFSPSYNPWDQRLCLVPDADLFTAIKSGKVSVVTDTIETFTETGIRLRSGEELAADIIVTATGLSMKLMSGARLIVDGKPVDVSKTMSYRGMMYSDIPNFATAMGYTNASWTLKCELTSAYVCRLLNHMARHGYTHCTPRRRDPSITEEPLLTFTSGYIQRAMDTLPHQGSRRPWKLYQNYALDLLSLRFGRLEDGTMEFAR
ncbi:MAG TPA: NAD(P)/FAD-dependent oxidoreductase [Ktedonobacterales bacterium]|nr:NAD(P)/FAD-dependent oxidoreductase [Ktedonobacterales bacterium]